MQAPEARGSLSILLNQLSVAGKFVESSVRKVTRKSTQNTNSRISASAAVLSSQTLPPLVRLELAIRKDLTSLWHSIRPIESAASDIRYR